MNLCCAGTSCVKYCTPNQLNPATGLPLECKCDMLKRIECWSYKNKQLRCGQFKQLLNQRFEPRDGAIAVTPDQHHQKCGAVCARQLAAL